MEVPEFLKSPCKAELMEVHGSFKLLKKFETPFSTGSGAINLYVFIIGLIAISSIKILKEQSVLKRIS